MQRADYIRHGVISIHALLAESDACAPSASGADPSFLSTLSLRRATHIGRGCVMIHRISIHALLAESDHDARCYVKGDIKFLSTLSLRRATRSPGSEWQRCRYFYPRSPCGERPVRRARCTTQYKISIHALLAESDQSQTARTGWCSYFYPRSPCGERPHIAVKCRHGQILISIHALLAESDLSRHGGPAHIIRISIHALLAESDEAHRRQPGSRL